MTNDFEQMQRRDSSGNSWIVPIPETVQTEFAACVAMDELNASLAAFIKTMTICSAACETLTRETDVADAQTEWARSQHLLQTAFTAVELPAKALITAVSKMLAV